MVINEPYLKSNINYKCNDLCLWQLASSLNAKDTPRSEGRTRMQDLWEVFIEYYQLGVRTAEKMYEK